MSTEFKQPSDTAPVHNDQAILQTESEDRLAEAGQYLTFRLANELYAIDILRVLKIKASDSVRRIPNVPDHILGVLDMHGTVATIIDLRNWLKMANDENPQTSIIIMLSLAVDEEHKIFGIVVDGVSDVIKVRHDDIKNKPDFGWTDDNFINGLIVEDDKTILLLDSKALVTVAEMKTSGN